MSSLPNSQNDGPLNNVPNVIGNVSQNEWISLDSKLQSSFQADVLGHVECNDTLLDANTFMNSSSHYPLSEPDLATLPNIPTNVIGTEQRDTGVHDNHNIIYTGTSIASDPDSATYARRSDPDFQYHRQFELSYRIEGNNPFTEASQDKYLKFTNPSVTNPLRRTILNVSSISPSDGGTGSLSVYGELSNLPIDEHPLYASYLPHDSENADQTPSFCYEKICKLNPDTPRGDFKVVDNYNTWHSSPDSDSSPPVIGTDKKFAKRQLKTILNDEGFGKIIDCPLDGIWTVDDSTLECKIPLEKRGYVYTNWESHACGAPPGPDLCPPFTRFAESYYASSLYPRGATNWAHYIDCAPNFIKADSEGIQISCPEQGADFQLTGCTEDLSVTSTPGSVIGDDQFQNIGGLIGSTFGITANEISDQLSANSDYINQATSSDEPCILPSPGYPGSPSDSVLDGGQLISWNDIPCDSDHIRNSTPEQCLQVSIGEDTSVYSWWNPNNPSPDVCNPTGNGNTPTPESCAGYPNCPEGRSVNTANSCASSPCSDSSLDIASCCNPLNNSGHDGGLHTITPTHESCVGYPNCPEGRSVNTANNCASSPCSDSTLDIASCCNPLNNTSGGGGGGGAGTCKNITCSTGVPIQGPNIPYAGSETEGQNTCCGSNTVTADDPKKCREFGYLETGSWALPSCGPDSSPSPEKSCSSASPCNEKFCCVPKVDDFWTPGKIVLLLLAAVFACAVLYLSYSKITKKKASVAGASDAIYEKVWDAASMSQVPPGEPRG